MGRQQASNTAPPASTRRAARARRAKQTVNVDIPALLRSYPRGRLGVEGSELIIEPGLVGQRVAAESTREPGKIAAKKATRTHRSGEEDDGISRGGSKSSSIGITHQSEKNESSSAGSMSQRANQRTRVRICIADTLQAAHQIHTTSTTTPASKQRDDPSSSIRPPARASKVPLRRIAILNMASPLRPGGGFLNGATAQEESLCMRTTLYPSLKEEFYRLPEVGAVYTRDVLVFRKFKTASDNSADSDEDDEDDVEVKDDRGAKGDLVDVPKNERYSVDVITAGMLRFPDVETVTVTLNHDEEGEDLKGDETGTEMRYANASDRILVEEKMRAILRIAVRKGVTHLILGAWGCGAYGNPVSEVAKCWRRVISGMAAPTSTKTQGKGSAGKRGHDRTGSQHQGKQKQPPRRETFSNLDIAFAIQNQRMAVEFTRHFLVAGSSTSASESAPNTGTPSPIVDGTERDDGMDVNIAFDYQPFTATLNHHDQNIEGQNEDESEDESNNSTTAKVDAELGAKIAELESQLERAKLSGRSEMQKGMLESMIRGLRAQKG